ncbi:MAG: DUF3987 domain-containing protein [bacterium]
MKNLNKSSILELTDGGILFYYKKFPELKNTKLNNGRYRNIRNHLRGERKPSLSCYERDGKWLLFDHADPDFSGDVFSIYSKINGVENFKEILRGIYKEMTGEEPSDDESEGDSIKMEQATLPEGVEYEVEVKDFESIDDVEKEFVSAHGITKSIMEKYNASFLASYTFNASNGKCYKIYPPNNSFILGFKSANAVKVYKPYDKDFKCVWLGEKPQDYVFGWSILKAMHDQLKYDEDYVQEGKVQIVLGAGEKDTMVMNGLGFPSVCLNSETLIYFPEIMFLLLGDLAEMTDWHVEIVIVFDNDETGIKQANLIKERHGGYDYGVRIVELPEKLKEAGGKDVSDWITLGLSREELVQLIKGDNVVNLSPVSDKSDTTISLGDNEVECVDQEVQINAFDDTKIVNESSFNDDYVSKLPGLLQEALIPFEHTDRLMMLMSYITVIGSAMRNIVGMFRNDKLYPNLYTIVIAPPASGKSQIKWAKEMLKGVEQFIFKQSCDLKKEYEQNLRLVEKGEMENWELGPEPAFQVLHIPTDITSSMLVKQIAENNGYGLMYDTEIDGLVESNKGNLRSFTDCLRKASEGEPIVLMRKTDREQIFIDEGRMSLLISGTPGQFVKLIPDSENGLFSRIFIVQFEGHKDWIDAFNPNPFDMYTHFEGLSEKVLEYYQELDSLPEPVKFELSKEQLIKLDEEFKLRLNDSKNMAGVDARATVMRLGAITTKIAMILSTLRRLESNQLHNQFECHPDDFEIAMSLTDVALHNAIDTLKVMKNERIEHCYRGKKLDYFHALPNNFTYAQSQEIAEKEDLKLKTAQKWVYDFRDKGFLTNPEKGKFIKVA